MRKAFVSLLTAASLALALASCGQVRPNSQPWSLMPQPPFVSNPTDQQREAIMPATQPAATMTMVTSSTP